MRSHKTWWYFPYVVFMRYYAVILHDDAPKNGIKLVEKANYILREVIMFLENQFVHPFWFLEKYGKTHECHK